MVNVKARNLTKAMYDIHKRTNRICISSSKQNKIVCKSHMSYLMLSALRVVFDARFPSVYFDHARKVFHGHNKDVR